MSHAAAVAPILNTPRERFQYVMKPFWNCLRAPQKHEVGGARSITWVIILEIWTRSTHAAIPYVICKKNNLHSQYQSK